MRVDEGMLAKAVQRLGGSDEVLISPDPYLVARYQPRTLPSFAPPRSSGAAGEAAAPLPRRGGRDASALRAAARPVAPPVPPPEPARVPLRQGALPGRQAARRAARGARAVAVGRGVGQCGAAGRGVRRRLRARAGACGGAAAVCVGAGGGRPVRGPPRRQRGASGDQGARQAGELRGGAKAAADTAARPVARTAGRGGKRRGGGGGGGDGARQRAGDAPAEQGLRSAHRAAQGRRRQWKRPAPCSRSRGCCLTVLGPHSAQDELPSPHCPYCQAAWRRSTCLPTTSTARSTTPPPSSSPAASGATARFGASRYERTR